jgi:hypothetical protein
MRPVDAEDLGPKDVFLQSLERCDHDPEFLDRFYARFMNSSPVVRQKFEFTDFQRQKTMLRRSFQVIALASAGDPNGLLELGARAETHSRRQLDIDPTLYDLWLHALIETAQEADPFWSTDIESAWRYILGIAIQHMIRRYED